jgi:alkaline phosphatase D
MSDFGGRDEPKRGPDDHAELLSELDAHDLATATAPVDASDEDVFDANPDADPDATFPQSVASGGPTPTGVILWTRVAPDAFDPGTPLGVQVAGDDDFDDPVYEGVVTDGDSVAAHDYTVKVDLDGRLDPDTEYRYRFVFDGVASRPGTCRTLPAPDDSPASVSFAVLACQNYLNGYYPALGYVADEDVDFIVHVGDFVYESDAGHFKGLGSYDYEGRELTFPSGHDRVWGLDDYRYLYRQYRSDRFLQRALEAHTLIAGWDDHEMVNDVYWDDRTDAPAGDHPRGDDPEFMTELVADAMHAWWENRDNVLLSWSRDPPIWRNATAGTTTSTKTRTESALSKRSSVSTELRPTAKSLPRTTSASTNCWSTRLSSRKTVTERRTVPSKTGRKRSI